MNNFKSIGKRVLSLFVALIMCVSLLPGTAFALELDCIGDIHYGEWLDDECIAEGKIHCNVSHKHIGTCSRCSKRTEHWATCPHNWYVLKNSLNVGESDSWHTVKCSKCGKEKIQEHTYAPATCQAPATCECGHQKDNELALHNPGDAWEKNDTQHWQKCQTPGCTEELNRSNHTYDASTGKCTVCGYECEHVYNGWTTDASEHTSPQEGQHWKACTVCGARAEEGSHYKHTLKATDTEEIWTCICGVEVQKNGHDFQWKYTDTQHWKVCANGGCTATSEKVEHQYNEDLMTKCECGATRPAASTECDHSKVKYLDRGDGMTHKVVCDKCGDVKIESQPHNFVGDMCAFCKAKKPAAPCYHSHMKAYPDADNNTHTWYCEDCKVAVEGFKNVGHNFKCVQFGTGSEKQHWKVCVDCEYRVVEDHDFTNGDCACGAKKPTTPVEPDPVDPNKCNHTGRVSYEAKAPTCEEGGNVAYSYCEKCKSYLIGDRGTNLEVVAEEEVFLEKLGHDWNAVNQKDPTCTENGMKAHYECSRCDALANGTDQHLVDAADLVLKASGHKLTAVPKVEPTCTTGGVDSHSKCEKCGLLFKGTNPDPVSAESLKINALDHSFTNYVSNNDATCTQDGTKTAKCDRCEATETVVDEGSQKPHTEVVDAAVAATCEGTGLTEGKHCSVCGKVFAAQETVEALGHKWDEGEVTTAPTCTGDGVRTYHCTRDNCTATKTEAVTSAGHRDVVDVARVEPTCTEAGSTAGKYCNACKQYTEAPEVIPALGHNMVTDAAKAPTCTETGLTEGEHCSRCDDATKAQEVVQPLGHDWDDGVVSTAATCEGAGVRTHSCKRDGCDATMTRAISATGHSVVSYANVAATCTTVGYTGGSYCSRCGAVITTRTTVPATGHAWNAGVITTAPTYYSTGLRTYTCTTCSATRTETIPQLTYTYNPDYTTPDPEPDEDPNYEPPVSSNRRPTTTIPDDNTPLGNTPNTNPGTVTIEDEDTPLANRPLPFIDVKNGDWFRPYVSYVFHKGMMNGMSETLFGPDVSTTRGMIVTIIYRMENASATGVSPFTDVERDEYYADPIAWASDNGVVLGYSETLFGPKDNITREQMAAILYRYCVSKGIDVANYGDLSRFPDGDKVSDYAVEAMRWAVDRGLIAGLDDGRLDPTGTATRAQVATILNRFCEMIGA